MKYFNSTSRQCINNFLVIPSPQGSDEKIIVGVSNTSLPKIGLKSNADLSFADKQRIAGAFATLAYHLPMRTYDIIDWIASDPHFNREAIPHYARDHFGMRRVRGRSRLAQTI